MGKYLTFIPVVLSLICLSCGSIDVAPGPFQIDFVEQELINKEDYLRELHNKENSKKQPNILLILVDDLGRDDISVYNKQGVPVPNLEKLSRSGIIFSDAYSTSSVCSPSRAGMLTGRYQQRFGFERQPMNRYPHGKMEYFFVDHFINTEPMRLISPMASPSKEEIEKQGIPPGELLLSEVLNSAGYNTGIFGKWHLGFNGPFLPNNRGFDQQYGFYEAFSYYALPKDKNIVNYRHDYFANRHIWRQKRKGTCAIRVNDSVVVEKEYLTFGIARHTIDFIEKNNGQPFFAYAAFSAPHTPFQVPVEYYDRFSWIEDDNRRVYAGMIAALDDAIGMIMDKLEQQGLLKNTLVLFASDNGGATYTGATDNGSLNAGKMTQFDGGIVVPCMISWEDMLPEGIKYEKPVSLMDFYSTALAAAGIDLPADRIIDGIDLLPYLKGMRKDDPHNSIYWRTDFNKAIRTGKWKMIWNTRDDRIYLYDLESDRGEQKNLAEDYPDMVSEFMEKIEKWESELKDPAWPGVMEIMFEINGEETWWAI